MKYQDPEKQHMEQKGRSYIAIDLKSFYASVECVARGLDPLTTNLVVADVSRTEKTICLAVSPSLKAYGIPGRARLFEVVQKVRDENTRRMQEAIAAGIIHKDENNTYNFPALSHNALELAADPSLGISYIAAKPQMAEYMRISSEIYKIYLKYIAPEDIHVYSIDEVFMDVTDYLETYKTDAHELAMTMIRDVLKNTGITATAGIGTNMYLCKIAMDIEAKHMKPDADGVRIAYLDERSYREKLWTHEPLTDFWRIGHGYSKKLHEKGLYTMGDIARCSLGGPNDYYNEDLLYKLFGINAELLIDHAWGYEPALIRDIKAYKPENNSISSGQVLQNPYSFEKGRLIVREMTDLLVLDLVSKGLVTNQMVLTVGYDIENLEPGSDYKGEIITDRYGRKAPKSAHGSENLDQYSSSTREITEAVMRLYDRIVDPKLTVRRAYVVANHVISELDIPKGPDYEQLDLFTDYAQREKDRENRRQTLAKERKMQEAILSLREKYGKNAVLRGMNLEEGATTIQRNGQIGGHKA